MTQAGAWLLDSQDVSVDPGSSRVESVQHTLALRGFGIRVFLLLDELPDKVNEIRLPGFEFRVVLLLVWLPTKAVSPDCPPSYTARYPVAPRHSKLGENRGYHGKVLLRAQ